MAQTDDERNMLLALNSIREEKPGRKWQKIFATYWPSYETWFLSEGHRSRPGYVTSRRKLAEHMPELMPVYERLAALAGGGDLAARFLSMYCPPPYLAGCSQAIWRRGTPLLIRNYDYDPRMFEGVLLYSCWLRPVIAMSDCLWGALDGLNDAGLAVSLAFGGRKVIGTGFGVPLVLRYLLETCDTTAQASEALARLPVHMQYNVTVIDRAGEYVTAFLSPDRPAIMSASPAITNHQMRVEWEDYVRVTSSVERREFLAARLADAGETAQSFADRFLKPPLFHTEYQKAFGTLYTAVYSPGEKSVQLLWPHKTLRQSLADFTEQQTVINLRVPYSVKGQK